MTRKSETGGSQIRGALGLITEGTGPPRGFHGNPGAHERAVEQMKMQRGLVPNPEDEAVMRAIRRLGR